MGTSPPAACSAVHTRPLSPPAGPAGLPVLIKGEVVWCGRGAGSVWRRPGDNASGDNISLVPAENFHPSPAPLLSNQLASGLWAEGAKDTFWLRWAGLGGAPPKPRPRSRPAPPSTGLVPATCVDHLPSYAVWRVGATFSFWAPRGLYFGAERKGGRGGEEGSGEGRGAGRAQIEQHLSVLTPAALRSPAPRVCLQTADGADFSPRDPIGISMLSVPPGSL